MGIFGHSYPTGAAFDPSSPWNQHEVDAWVSEQGEYDAHALLDERLPKMRAKLNKLDKQIRDVLEEVNAEFPDAQYYTASGGFNLILGDTHENGGEPQQQRTAWSGQATIADGDW